MNRKQWIEKRRQIAGRKRKDDALASGLLPFLHPEDLVGFYVPLPGEADVYSSLHDQFQCAVPKVLDSERIAFYPDGNLHPGCFHVLEPEEGREVVPDVLVIPMLVFCDGYRIGYGKGYYDRYLSKHPECKRIGIAYDEQEGTFLPSSWDERLDILVTPTRTLYFERESERPAEQAVTAKQSERR